MVADAVGCDRTSRASGLTPRCAGFPEPGGSLRWAQFLSKRKKRGGHSDKQATCLLHCAPLAPGAGLGSAPTVQRKEPVGSGTVSFRNESTRLFGKRLAQTRESAEGGRDRRFQVGRDRPCVKYILPYYF